MYETNVPGGSPATPDCLKHQSQHSRAAAPHTAAGQWRGSLSSTAVSGHERHGSLGMRRGLRARRILCEQSYPIPPIILILTEQSLDGLKVAGLDATMHGSHPVPGAWKFGSSPLAHIFDTLSTLFSFTYSRIRRRFARVWSALMETHNHLQTQHCLTLNTIHRPSYSPSTHLEVSHRGEERVVPQWPLFIQKLASTAILGRTEEAIIEALPKFLLRYIGIMRDKEYNGKERKHWN
ncbi:hypothetical protein E2C01_020661 [Portunus trituberculatus]|uniref:Uncharacterized protein n=1 Tax=Portunus trituberculatus TaxID=210409 RepID=A0A5B7E0R8_PORTR|nr:hypothetical protein [Portunus trituberculatus]